MRNIKHLNIYYLLVKLFMYKYHCFAFFRDYIFKKLKVNTHLKKQIFVLLELRELRLSLQKTSDIFGELIYSLVAYQFIKMHKK